MIHDPLGKKVWYGLFHGLWRIQGNDKKEILSNPWKGTKYLVIYCDDLKSRLGYILMQLKKHTTHDSN